MVSAEDVVRYWILKIQRERTFAIHARMQEVNDEVHRVFFLPRCRERFCSLLSLFNPGHKDWDSSYNLHVSQCNKY